MILWHTLIFKDAPLRGALVLKTDHIYHYTLRKRGNIFTVGNHQEVEPEMAFSIPSITLLISVLITGAAGQMLAPESVTPGGEINTGDNIYGNDVRLRFVYLPDQAYYSWIDTRSSLPKGILTKFYVHSHNVGVTKGAAAIRLQVWRPEGTAEFRLIAEVRVLMESSLPSGSLYVFVIPNGIPVKQGDHIGWTFETEFGPISFEWSTASSGHRVYIRPVNTSFPEVNGIYNFNNIFLTALFSIAAQVSPVTGLFSCTFEDSVCDMESQTIEGSGSLLWQRQSGPTLTSGTGPSGGQGRSTWYVYFETSNPVANGQTGTISTGALQNPGMACVSFYYHMFGTSIDTLTLLRRTQGNSVQVWSISQNQGNIWKQQNQTVFLPTNETQVIWQARKGSTDFHGDIALDSISITAGPCDNPSPTTSSTSTSTTTSTTTTPTTTSPTTTTPTTTMPTTTTPTTTTPTTTTSTTTTTLAPSTTTTSTTTTPTTTPTTTTLSTTTRTTPTSTTTTPTSTTTTPTTTTTTTATTSTNTTTRETTSPGSPENRILHCAFDDIGDCGLRLDINPGGNPWVVWNGSTPSANTGPSGGQGGTLGYIYFETSDPVPASYQSRFSTGPLEAEGDVCVSFFYHMYGYHMGSLMLYTQNGVFDTGSRVYHFNQTGDLGDFWFSAFVTVTLDSSNSVVGWEAMKGEDYLSDIAVDSVTITTGACDGTVTPPVSTSQPSEALFVCDFSSVCAFIQDPTDDHQWLVNSGETPSSETGPPYGVGGVGKYIYFEASDPVQPGEMARMMTFPLKQTGKACVSFWYHMYGESMGSLLLYLLDAENFADGYQTVLRVSGDQGRAWIFVSVDVDLTSLTNKVGWQATKGSEYSSDIALDDIVITSGVCRGSGSQTTAIDGSSTVSDLTTEDHDITTESTTTAATTSTTTTATPTSSPDLKSIRVSPEVLFLREGTTGRLWCTLFDSVPDTSGVTATWFFPNGTAIPYNTNPNTDRFVAKKYYSQTKTRFSTSLVVVTNDPDYSGSYRCEVTARGVTETRSALVLVEGCAGDHFKCSDDSCIPLKWRCDGRTDCLDFSDELRCT